MTIYKFKDGTPVEAKSLPLGSICRYPVNLNELENLSWAEGTFPTLENLTRLKEEALKAIDSGADYYEAFLSYDDRSSCPTFMFTKTANPVGVEDFQRVYISYGELLPPLDYVPSEDLIERHANQVWHRREERRIDEGEYYVLDVSYYGLQKMPEHFLHWSTTEGEKLGKVSFTMTSAHGKADRQTVMKLGKYLKKYYPEVKDHVIRDLVGQMTSVDFDLHILTSYEDIYKAYQQIDESCMAVGKVIDNPHPCIVYADNPDVAVGFVEQTGRAVLNMVDKTFDTIYGDKSRMIPLLEKAGFTLGHTGLKGCKLHKIFHEEEREYVMPYLDGVQDLDDLDNGYYRVVSHTTGLSGCSTSGLLSVEDDEGEECHHCSNRTADYEHNTDDELICSDCIDTTQHRMVWAGSFTRELVDTNYHTCYEYEGDLYNDEGLERDNLIITEDDIIVKEDDAFYDELMEQFRSTQPATEYFNIDLGELSYTNRDSVLFELDYGVTYKGVSYLYTQYTSYTEFLIEHELYTNAQLREAS